MEIEQALKPLSAAIATPILKAYKAGGFGLVFVFTGTLLLLASLFYGEGVYRVVASGAGAAMIFLVLALFYFHDIRKLSKLNRNIARNAELIDQVQLAAIEMTEVAGHLQSLAFKHADRVAAALEELREHLLQLKSLPLLANIPVVGKVVSFVDERSESAVNLAGAIVGITEKSKIVIDEVRSAIVNSDPAILKARLEELRGIDGKLVALLQAAPNELPTGREKAAASG